MNPLQYWHKGKWVNMEERDEVIYGPGKQTSQEVTLYRSVYGPIVSVDEEAGKAVTMHLPYYKNELAAEQGWMVFQQATNVDECGHRGQHSLRAFGALPREAGQRRPQTAPDG
jgi:acyl-homoserine lactone acylase PvdQ